MLKTVMGTMAHLLNSLGVALLVCSLLLVPSQMALADDGGGGPDIPGGCSGTAICDTGCKAGAVCPLVPPTGCAPAAPPPGFDCSGCGCDVNPVTLACFCSPGH